jgi:hypothetical protein
MLPSDTRKASRPCPSMISTGDCIEEHDHQRYWDAEKRAPSSVKSRCLGSTTGRQGLQVGVNPIQYWGASARRVAVDRIGCAPGPGQRLISREVTNAF